MTKLCPIDAGWAFSNSSVQFAGKAKIVLHKSAACYGACSFGTKKSPHPAARNFVGHSTPCAFWFTLPNLIYNLYILGVYLAQNVGNDFAVPNSVTPPSSAGGTEMPFQPKCSQIAGIKLQIQILSVRPRDLPSKKFGQGT